MAAGWKRARRWLFLLHRWSGIGTCLLFAMWFGSGAVMLYVPFPRLTEAERLERLAPIDWARVRLSPAEAVIAAGLDAPPREMALEMLGGAPAYRLLGGDGVPRAVSAETGAPRGPVDGAAALALVRAAGGAPAPRLVATLERDQWSVPERYGPDRPLHRVALGDAAGTELYISSRTGAVLLDTTARERFWNLLGAVPHWFYVTPLRADRARWRGAVLWVSGACIVAAASGFVVGLLRLGLRRRHRGGAVSPYRGWALWHHLGGLLGGVFLLGWIVSGWLSVDPGRLFGGPVLPREALDRYEALTLPAYAADPAALAAAGGGAVSAAFGGVGGRLVVTLRRADGGRTVVDAGGVPFRPSPGALLAAAAALLPSATVAGSVLLTEPDEQWYPHHDDPRPLPVLRVRFDDPAGTWVHLDPADGAVLGAAGSRQRLYRWLFAAPHRLDFAPLRTRPAWDAAMLGLLALGATVSVAGAVLAFRHLRRRSGRTVARGDQAARRGRGP